MKTFGQIAHDAGKFDRQWHHMGESQKADWERIAQAVIDAQQVAVPDGEGWYGHKFKEGTRGIWRCDCGKQLTDGENKCTNGTQNTLQSQPLTADAEDTQTHADTYPEREAHALSIPEVVSHEAQQVAVPPGFALVPTEALLDIKNRVNTLATLSLKAERYSVGRAIKQDIADMLAAAQGAKP